VPLLIAFVSYWIVGFGASWAMAFALGLGAVGVWIGLSAGTTVFAALLLWRFRALTQTGYIPAVAGST
jgi:MATE family multidrug resistance protein